MPKGAQTSGKILSLVVRKPESQDCGADALPTEPRLHMITIVITAECDRDAAMRNAANKNVALSACPITAHQSAKPTSRPALGKTL